MKKILVIEDNENILENTAEILQLSNYSVVVAENGKIGVEMAIRHKPDLIICDILMPELDGYGVLNYSVIKTLETPLVILVSTKKEFGSYAS